MVRITNAAGKRSDLQCRAHVAPAGLRHLAFAAPRMRIVGVVGLVVMLVLPLLGFSLAEIDPSHEHILVGGTAAEQLSALTSHLYHHLSSPWPPTRGPQTDGLNPATVASDSCVVSVLSSSAAGAAVLALGGAGLVGAGRCVAPGPALAGRVVMTQSAIWWEVSVLTPDPPPRWS